MEPIPPRIRAQMALIDPVADVSDIAAAAELVGQLENDIPETDEYASYYTEPDPRTRCSRRGKTEILPAGIYNWDVTSLFIFLNNLPGTWVVPNAIRFDKKTGTSYCCTFENCPLGKIQRVRLKISPGWEKVSVKVTRSWLPPPRVWEQLLTGENHLGHEELMRIWEPWRPVEVEVLTTRGSRGRPLAAPKQRKTRRYLGRFRMRHSSQWIKQNRFRIIHDKSEFGKPLRYLVKTLKRLDAPFLPPDTDLFNALQEALDSGRCPQNEGSSEFVIRNRPGHLTLKLTVPELDDARHRISQDGNELSVSSGCWVSPYAAAILRENEVDGLIMDTTFKVTRQYHTAILLAVVDGTFLDESLLLNSMEVFSNR